MIQPNKPNPNLVQKVVSKPNDKNDLSVKYLLVAVADNIIK